MLRIAIVVLIGRWVDLYLMVAPSAVSDMTVWGLWEVAAVSCLVGVGGLLIARSFATARPVPAGDPYLSESLHYHVE